MGSGGHGHGHGHHHGHGHGAGSHDAFGGPSEAHAPDNERRALLVGPSERARVLFLDCPSGAAGDMIVAALLDLGLSFGIVEEAVSALEIPGVQLGVTRVSAGAIAASRFAVTAEGPQLERSYQDIVHLLAHSRLSPAVRDLSLRIFEVLGRAEASVHGVPLEHVHFHEVGAIDSIVDIVGASALFVALDAPVLVSPLPLGRGFVESRHGPIPLPAPATLLCLAGVPTYPSGLEAELVTPTGAAIIRAIAHRFVSWPSLSPIAVGYGAGTRTLPDRPNALRAVLGEPSVAFDELSPPTETVVLLEANIDDSSSEVLGYALDRAFAAGALDAWVTPIVMKKSRPAFTFSVLTEPGRATHLLSEIFRETSTIGVRETTLRRHVLPRRVEMLETLWGPVRFKLSGQPTLTVKPELDDAIVIAEREKLPLRLVLAKLQELGLALLSRDERSKK